MRTCIGALVALPSGTSSTTRRLGFAESTAKTPETTVPMPDQPSESESASTPAGRTSAAGNSTWTRDLLERFARESLAEKRRARRWNLALRFAWFAFFVTIVFIWSEPQWLRTEVAGRHSALVDVSGIISDEGDASADRIVAALQAAFGNSDTAGVIVRINSPGGTPVQAGYINDEIVRLRGLHPDTPLYAVIADVAVSGGYYVAAAADTIYASRSSVVGSIGVLMDGFGFVDAMDKLGVERRLITAGEHKGLLDPFSPTSEKEVEHLQSMLGEVHDEFVAAVKRGRGNRLADDADLFSGLIWTGVRGKALGLVDAFGSSSYVAREVIGAENIVDFTVRPSHLDTIADRLGAGVARTLAAVLGLEAAGIR